MWFDTAFFYFVLSIFFVALEECAAQKTGVGQNGNLRVCIVEGKGLYKRAGRFCPVLEKENSGLECVVGNDRLDCLRRIGKGTVDFGVFSPEDLVAAQWAGIDVLVTHELKSTPDPFEYSVVALISKELSVSGGSLAGAESVLRGATLCHPGLGAEEHFSEALTDYLESLVVERSCDPNLSLTENKLKSVAEFFKSACRAGPWLPDKYRDNELKTKYGQLCAACYEPRRCSTSDKYWGRQGALNCLAEHAGDVAWARHDDVMLHFGFTRLPATSSPEHFMYLCRDGSVRPLTNDTEPCVWVGKPWPVIAAKRKSSPVVQATADAASPALRALLELQRTHLQALSPPATPADYLARARGFRAAYSRADCQPSRHITVCAATVSGRYKCDWLAEAGTVQGVVPPLQCIQHDECVSSVISGAADVMVAGPDFLVPARRKHGLMPILYESTPILNDLYSVAAYVKKDSNIGSFSDMRYQRVAFPSYDGVAWHSIVQLLKREHLIPELRCPYEESLAEFFGDSCVPGLEMAEGVSEYVREKLTRQCRKNAVRDVKGDGAALRLLAEGLVDIAFISISSMKNYTDGASIEPWAVSLKSADFKHVCPTGNSFCYLSWATIGQIYIRQNTTKARQSEIKTAFKQLDDLFGVSRLFHTAAFSMYGPFDHRPDVLFHDRTKKLRSFEELKIFPMGGLHDNFEQSLVSYEYGHCLESFGFCLTYSSVVLYVCLFVQLLNR